MHRILNSIAFALLLALPLAVPAVAGAAPAGSNNPSRAVPGEVLVGFAGDSSKPARERAAESIGSDSRQRVARGSGEIVQLLQLPRGLANSAAINRLRRDPAVE